MWEPIVEEKSFLELPPATRKVFVRFVNCANRAALHPLDWRRFYLFIHFCHAKRVKMRVGLKKLLVRGHFSEDQAAYLADVYERGRELLAARLGP